MVSDSEHFLINSNSSTKLKVDGVALYLREYDYTLYKDSLFSKLKIHLPTNIGKSTIKRKAEFLAGRFCAEKALNMINIRQYTVHSDKNRCPLWPEGIKGSITHNNNFAMAAITTKPSVLGIGIDIERIISSSEMNEIKDEVLFDDEFKVLELATYTPEILFSLIFSIKESFFKAVYPSTGVFFGFNAVRVTSFDFKVNQFELVVCKDLSVSIRNGKSYRGRFDIFSDIVLTMVQIE